MTAPNHNCRVPKFSAACHYAYPGLPLLVKAREHNHPYYPQPFRTGARVMILWLKRLNRWLVAVIRWIVRPRWVWVTLGLGVGVFQVRYILPFPLDDCMRLTGLSFQLLGLGAVAKGLRETHKLFNRPNLRTFAAECLRDVPHKPKF